MKAFSQRSRAGRGVIAGVFTGAVAVGVGQLVAGITGPSGSPVVATGQLQIDFTPPWLKNFAIREFGSHDKQILVGGILIMLALFAAVLGVLAMRRLAYGLAGLAVFGAAGVARGGDPADRQRRHRPADAGRRGRRDHRDADAHPRGPREPAGFAAAGCSPGCGSGRESRDDLRAGPLVRVARDGAAACRAAGRTDPRRRGSPRPPGGQPLLGRRRSLVVSGAAAGTAAVAGLGGRVLAGRFSVASARAALRIPAPAVRAPALPPGADLHIPGLSPFITPNGAFYRVDTAIVMPQIEPASRRLRVHGMVAREITLSFAELIRRPLIEDYITLCCVSQPGRRPLHRQRAVAGRQPGQPAAPSRNPGRRGPAAVHLRRRVHLRCPRPGVMDGRDALLAVAMNPAPLPVAHGFPARMVVPGLYGYVSACKWVTDIEVTTYAAATAYWSAGRGWDKQAPVKTESRIDVPTGSNPLSAGKTPIAGVAWAQHKGIDAVEVRVDRGPWRQARLAAVPGIDTWRQWAWDWDATPGTHLIEARATDRTGYTRTAIQAPPEPNGATGYPSVTVTVS